MKAADRIDNLMQMNFKKFKKPDSDEYDEEKNKEYIRQYLDETEQYVVPGVENLHINLAKELKDLLVKLRKEHGV